MRTRAPIADRFWAKVKKTEGCWEWTGALTYRGYGTIYQTAPRTKAPAHRVSWELHNGPIPEGMFVCHHCDHRKCVRPDHLFLGDSAANMLDARLKGRFGKPDILVRVPCCQKVNSHCRHGHQLTPENIYIDPDGRRSCRICLRAKWAARDRRNKQLKKAA